MRVLITSAAASMMVLGAVAFGSVPAFAGGDEAQMDSFWSSQSNGGGQPTLDRNGRPVAPHYIQVEPRDAKADANAAQNVDANNAYFNHSMGTMSADPGANYATPAAPNGEYTASYRQPYMQVEPRDAKVDPNAAGNVDGNNIYFNHSMGTMSGN